MFNKIKILSLSVCAALMLQACHDDDYVATSDAPKQVFDVSQSVYAQMKAGSANSLFLGAASAIAGTTVTSSVEPCQVKLHKMAYDTVGGAGEATTSTGVVMVPYGTNALCNGPRPVVLYAHGTNADRNYDLSKIIADPTNAANTEGAMMLAYYAAQGYVVIAPNYAGYADSNLSYHPYVDEKQQSTEMIDALDHVRTHAGNIGAELSSKLFVTGLSQGGYVAMATHKALQAKGETVTASAPISGPYVISSYLDRIMEGYVNYGATMFAPMYLTALEKAHNIYDDPSDVYAVAGVENIFPNPGADDTGIPDFALFAANSTPVLPTAATQAFPGGAFQLGYGTPHLLKQTFRDDYLAAKAGSSAVNAAFKAREQAKAGNLNNWTPAAPVFMCGAGNDPVVYHDLNSDAMASSWASLGALVTNVDLADGAGWNAAVQAGGLWAQQAQVAQIAIATAIANGTTPTVTVPLQPEGSIAPADIHGTTGAFCAAVALRAFNAL